MRKFLSRKRGRAETRRNGGRRFRGGLGIVAGLTVMALGPHDVRALEITLPQETARLVASPLPGYDLAQALCLTCHSADYMKMQPVAPRAFWQASVAKMQKTFGAQIPENAVEPIVDYLAKTYGNERPAAPEKRIEPVKPATSAK